ncbi:MULTISPECIES: hypothetical protein [Bacteria]|uniref:hypothetical protein n=1 Tax=Bacteria TaxID=2 RepID=UPI001FAE90AA|nr:MULTISPECIES: hypothetical protein [Bacteria]
MTRITRSARSCLALPILALLATAAAPVPPSARERAVMDAIERSIVLPAKARPLAAYGRNYAWADPTHVVANYLLPSSPPAPNQGCDVMIENFKSRPCTRAEIADMARRDAKSRAAETPAGQRRWFAHAHDLPFIFDGGCIQVTVAYDVVSRSITRTQCNGYA